MQALHVRRRATRAGRHVKGDGHRAPYCSAGAAGRRSSVVWGGARRCAPGAGPSGERCEVHAAVLLKTSDDQIVHEALHYGADSLISCGWAR